MSILSIRSGQYGMYNGKLYRIGKTHTDSVDLASINRDDLNNGFTWYRPELYINEYNFVCVKNVPKSEISELYKIETHAIYKGEAVNIIGGRSGTNLLTLSTQDLLPYYPTGEQLEIKNRLLEKGFHEGQHERIGCWYEIEVDRDDLELELIEEIEKVDLSEL